MVKAAVLGAAGGIGQPLSLLLKACPLITELALFDVVNTPGVASDLSHIATPAVTTGYLNADDGLQKALEGCEIVVIPAGLPRKPGMSRDELFTKNAGIVAGLIKGVAQWCPKAYVLVISNPVNSTVPIAAEILKAHNVFDARRLFGVTTLDVVRASTFTAELTGEKDPRKLTIPVVGGHSGDTIVPLLSQASPAVSIPEDKVAGLINRIQFGGDEVVKAKDGAGSATLSMAYAGFRFAEAVLRAHNGEKGIVEPSFVYLPGVPGGDEVLKRVDGLEYFAVPVELGPGGVVRATNPLASATEAETGLLETAVAGLRGSIAKGVGFVQASSAKL